MSNSVWDDPALRVTSDYIKFESPGDTVTGTVIEVRTHTWDDGSKCPQVLLDVDGDEKSLTAGQVQLKALLAEQRPEAGDTLTVTFTGTEPRPGGKTLKRFTVNVERGSKPASGGWGAEQDGHDWGNPTPPAAAAADADAIAAAKALLAEQGLQ